MDVRFTGARMLALAVPLVSGCWKTDLPALPVGTVPFEPEANPALAGWVVEEFETTLVCPDESSASLYAVYPEGAAGALPVAVILHSGAFDYIIDPPASDPLGAPSYQSTTRLTSTWAVRKTWATLGMFEDNDPVEDSVGALAASLAAANVAMIVPTNCWGDWWHNQQGVAENDYAGEHFYRDGRAAASLAWQLASEPGAAGTQGIPVTFDTGHTYLIGLGEGGRGVGELLDAGATPDAIAIDSSTDDLGVYYADPTLYEATITGLNRIYPGGQATTADASLASVTTLPPTAYVYSSLDPQIPDAAHDDVLARLGARSGDLVRDAAVQRHVITGSDTTLAGEVVSFLIAH